MADRYWVNDDADGDFSGANNWSAADGGAGGASVPGTGDIAYFTGNGIDNCTLSASVASGGFNTAAGYTGTLDAATFDVTGDSGADFIFDGTGLDLGSGTWSVTNGTFDVEHITNAVLAISPLIEEIQLIGGLVPWKEFPGKVWKVRGEFGLRVEDVPVEVP